MKASNIKLSVHRLSTIYSPGDKVEGSVQVEASTDENTSVINLNFVGRMSVEIKSRNPTINTVNVAQHNFFRITKCIKEGSWERRGLPRLPFEVYFPDNPALLPSYLDGETQKLGGGTGKGRVEYYLEVQVLAPNMASVTSERQWLSFRPHRYSLKPAAIPAKIPVEFTCQSAQLAVERKSTFRDRFRSSSSSSSKDPKVHFRISFVHSTEAILGQTLHLFMDLAPDPDLTTALTVPPVYLKSLKVVLVAEHTLSTSYGVDEQNGIPTKWNYRRPYDILRFKANEASPMVLIYDKCDLRPHFKFLKIPMSILPTIDHENIKVSYHIEVAATFDCLGETFKQDFMTSKDMRLLPSVPAPALSVGADVESDANNTWGTFTDEEKCPVCQKQLPLGPESARQGHLDVCLTAATSVEVPARPRTVLIVDDYDDFTSPFAVAFITHMRKKQDLFARCIGRAVWAEHEHFDVLELPASAEALQSLLNDKGILWTRLPRHRYWEAEELHSYDYILYAGRQFHEARRMLDNAPPTFETVADDQPPHYNAIKRATLINMANLIPRHKWPHNAQDMETAWTQVATPEARLDRQFEVIKDCILEFTWQQFRLALPGFARQDHPDRVEAPGHLPVELPVPRILPPEMPAVRDPAELPATQLSVRRPSASSGYSQQSNDEDDELYSIPRRPVQNATGDTNLQPPDDKLSFGYRSVPSNVYELP